MVHVKCRGGFYPFSKIVRLAVADNQVPWNFLWKDYNPPTYTSDILKGKPWSDPDISDSQFKPLWNNQHGSICRTSHGDVYQIVDGYPLNPQGRTGLKGRGVLGRWGPNHAADPIVSRWKRVKGEKVIHEKTKMPILQICLIQRRDNNEWALPGGMIDPGEKVSTTLRREFLEEAMRALELPEAEVEENKLMINLFFTNGQLIYNGYVDDPRNTDNAWMETQAFNFHDEDGDLVGKFNLQAGDDAKNVKWEDISKEVLLYASHSKMIELVVNIHNAHW